jgi:hypothetical protein
MGNGVLRIAPLSMSAVIRLTAAAPATLIGAYWAVLSDDVALPVWPGSVPPVWAVSEWRFDFLQI